MIRLQDDPIRLDRLMEEIRQDADGALAVFVGTVRDHHRGRKVLHLEYSAYPEMARKEMAAIERETLESFEIRELRLVHRLGRLELGEASVAVVVAAAHRAAAMDACRFVIDTLKERVPIWKKEFFEGGEAWHD